MLSSFDFRSPIGLLRYLICSNSMESDYNFLTQSIIERCDSFLFIDIEKRLISSNFSQFFLGLGFSPSSLLDAKH